MPGIENSSVMSARFITSATAAIIIMIAPSPALTMYAELEKNLANSRPSSATSGALAASRFSTYLFLTPPRFIVAVRMKLRSSSRYAAALTATSTAHTTASKSPRPSAIAAPTAYSGDELPTESAMACA